jgi:hypothetical protein
MLADPGLSETLIKPKACDSPDGMVKSGASVATVGSDENILTDTPSGPALAGCPWASCSCTIIDWYSLPSAGSTAGTEYTTSLAGVCPDMVVVIVPVTVVKSVAATDIVVLPGVVVV